MELGCCRKSTITCPQPPLVPNSRVNYPNRNVGSVANYTCFANYRPIGIADPPQTNVTCLPNGRWTSADFACVAKNQFDFVNLPPPLIITDSGIPDDVAGIPVALLFGEEGAPLNLPAISNSFCQSLPRIKHGSIVEEGSTSFSTAIGSRLSFMCGHGFYLAGPNFIECLENLNWTEPPTCRPYCRNPPIVPDSVQRVVLLPKRPGSGNFFTANMTVEYVCNSGYVLVSRNGANLAGNDTSERVVTCLENGQWSDPPMCLRVEMEEMEPPHNEFALSIGLETCGPPPPTRHGNVTLLQTSRQYTLGDRARYTCNKGYRLVGPTIIECMPNLKWSMNPTCVSTYMQDTCPPPPIVPDSIHVKANPDTGWIAGETVLYLCQRGFFRSGDPVVQCMPRGYWTSPPRCLLQPKTTTEDVTTTEKPPPRVLGQPSLRSGSFPSAHTFTTTQFNKFDCQPPPNVDNGYIVQVAPTEGRYPRGTVVTYRCAPDFTLYGDASVMCTDLLQWDPAPQCRISYNQERTTHFPAGRQAAISYYNECQPTPPLPPNTRITERYMPTGKATIGSFVVLDCLPDHIMIDGAGSPILWCDSNYRWQQQEPPLQCVPKYPQTTQQLLPSTRPRPIYNWLPTFGGNNQPYTTRRPIMYRSTTPYGPLQFLTDANGDPYWPEMLTTTIAPITGTTEVPSCLPPPEISNGFMVKITRPNYQNAKEMHRKNILYYYGVTVTYICAVGYNFMGASTIMCQWSGEWSGVPLCVLTPPMTPPKPPTTPWYTDLPEITLFPRVTPPYWYNTTIMSDSVTTTSNSDYQDGQTTSLQYQNTDMAPQQSTSSSLQYCNLPPTIADGVVIGRSPTMGPILPGTSVQYACMGDLMIYGRSVVYCLPNGQWETPPVCVPAHPGGLESTAATTTVTIATNAAVTAVTTTTTVPTSATKTPTGGGVVTTDTTVVPETSVTVPSVDTTTPVVTTVRPWVPSGVTAGIGSVTTSDNDVHWTEDTTPETPWTETDTESIPVTPDPWVEPSTEPTEQPTEQPPLDTTPTEETTTVTTTTIEETEPMTEPMTMSPTRPRQQQCVPPPTIPNGELIYVLPLEYASEKTYYIGTASTYGCRAGYRMIGSPTAYCGNDFSWHGVPVCAPEPTTTQQVRCSAPPNIPNGFITANTAPSDGFFKPGSSVQYQCNQGYRMIGFPRIFCTFELSWEGAPICEAETTQAPMTTPMMVPVTEPPSTTQGMPGISTCASPPPVSHAILISVPAPPYTMGAIARYACSPGYALMGPDSVVCLPFSVWSTPPECIPFSTVPTTTQYIPQQDCPPPPTIRYGTSSVGGMTAVSYSPGSAVVYSCDPGFALVGTAIVICAVDGAWSTPPDCIPQRNLPSPRAGFSMPRRACPEPPAVLHGYRSSQSITDATVGWQTGDSFDVECFPPYLRLGRSKTVCSEGGTWSALPSCVLPNYGNSRPKSAGPFRYRTETRQQNSRTTQQQVGKSCSQPPAVEHAAAVLRSGSGQLPGAAYLYICEPPYRLRGSPTVICSATGQWSEVPICEKGNPSVSDVEPERTDETTQNPQQLVYCGPPPTVENGKVANVPATSQVGSVVTYQCLPHFKLRGPFTISCQSSGRWSKTPECLPTSPSQRNSRAFNAPSSIRDQILPPIPVKAQSRSGPMLFSSRFDNPAGLYSAPFTAPCYGGPDWPAKLLPGQLSTKLATRELHIFRELTFNCTGLVVEWRYISVLPLKAEPIIVHFGIWRLVHPRGLKYRLVASTKVTVVGSVRPEETVSLKLHEAEFLHVEPGDVFGLHYDSGASSQMPGAIPLAYTFSPSPFTQPQLSSTLASMDDQSSMNRKQQQLGGGNHEIAVDFDNYGFRFFRLPFVRAVLRMI